MRTCFGCANSDRSVGDRRASDSMLLAVLTCTQCSSDTYYECDSSDSNEDGQIAMNEKDSSSASLAAPVKPIFDYRFSTPFISPLFALRRLVHPGLDTVRRRENCLHIWIQEAKGLTDKHRYHCEIQLDGVTYARTTSKRLTDMLFWGEEFDLSGLPEFENLCVQLWQDSNRPMPIVFGSPRPQTNSPPVSRSGTSAPSPHTRTSHPNSSTSNANLIQSPITTRKSSTMMMSCARGSGELLGLDECNPDEKKGFPLNGDGDHEDVAGVGHVLRERSDNVITNPRPTGSSKSAPVRRRAARRGKLKQHKHCTDAQLIATVTIPATKMKETTEVESWYPATLCDLCSRPKRSPESIPGSNMQGKSKGNQKNVLSGTQNNANGSTPTSSIQLRIKTRHRSVLVLPLISYSCLQHYLAQFQSPSVQENSRSVTRADSEDSFDASVFLSNLDPWLGVKAKAELAGSIVAFQQAIGQAPQFLIALILHEVHKQADPNMVLRGNSIATKATEIYLRLIGENYLSHVLSDFVRTVITGDGAVSVVSGRTTEPQTGKTPKQARIGGSSNTMGVGSGTCGVVLNGTASFPDCEVDAAKLQSSSQLAQNQEHLKHLVEVVWERIVSSEAYFPEKLRTIFSAVRDYLDSVYPPSLAKPSDLQQATLSEHVISACVFLRYLCPAILSPSLFGLTTEFPSEPRVLRAFTLVAKTIQSLANFSLFAGSKEVYMTFMNPFVSSQLPAMRRFLYAISSPSLHVHRSITEPESFVQSGQHLDSAVSLTQSICLPQAGSGLNRTLLTSHSHHGAFLEDSSATDRDLLSDSSLLTRSIARIPSGNHSNRLVSQTDSDKQAGFVTHSDAEGLSRIPLPLPQLPCPVAGSQTGSYMDLALCLALCHLQLSEAMQKIPIANASPQVTKIKPVLEEIDFFLKSGVEPSSSWWPQDFTSSSRQKADSSQTPVQSNFYISAANFIPSTTVSTPFRMKQSHSDTLTRTDLAVSDHQPGKVRPKQNSDWTVDTNVQEPQDDSVSEHTSSQSNVLHRLSPRPYVPPLEMPRSPSQKAFVSVSCGSPSTISHPVRSCSGSELTRSGSEGSRHVHNQLPSVSKQDCSIPIGTVTADSLKKPYPGYEQIPLPPPYTPNGVEQQSMVKSVDVSVPQGSTNSKQMTDDGILWTMDRDIHLPSVVSIPESVLSANPEPIQMIPLMHSNGLVPLVSSENQAHSTHMYATHSSSSGYQSLRSHDTTAVGNSSIPYGLSYDCQLVSADTELSSGLRRPSNPCSALAMSNPLYAFHEPRPTAISPPLFSSLDEADLPPKDPRSPPASQATPMRAKVATPRSARRHTYVNLANGKAVEAVFSLVRLPRRRASITSDPAAAQVSSPRDDSSPNPSFSVMDTSATPAGYGGSLVTLSSEPIDALGPRVAAPTRAHSTHRPNSTDSDTTALVTTVHATVEGLNLRIPRRNGSLKCPTPDEKGITSFRTDSVQLDPESIRDELDASQARLAEAQARLLANEAERIQLLRAWHNELMKQSQLVTYGSRVNSPGRPYDSETFTIPRVSTTDQPGVTVAHRRDTVPLAIDSSDPTTLDYSVAASHPTHSLSRTFCRPTYGTRPRMGASLIGTGYMEPSGSQMPPAESNQTTIIPHNRTHVAWTTVSPPTPVTAGGMSNTVSLSPDVTGTDNACSLSKSPSDNTPADLSRAESVTVGWDQPDAERHLTSD
ncbi:Disabled 2-interacting protein [Fasciola hepatica]|uniref:Disabled 2-interacting protein n=1 Tax=Fasciola hepatica TaxID=6192 RepID=A0A4E0QZT8_FASHE|nr:Disabled 2-interacting protein [Fasciola hepatica]